MQKHTFPYMFLLITLQRLSQYCLSELKGLFFILESDISSSLERGREELRTERSGWKHTMHQPVAFLERKLSVRHERQTGKRALSE